MTGFIPYKIFDDTFLLSSNRTVFWEDEKSLILSDLHLGKSGHFRKSGIAIPQTIFKEDMQRLLAEIKYFNPLQLIIVGDLFHSAMNREHELFLRWRNDIRDVSIHLVKGNHDILKKEWYEEAGITVHPKHLSVRKFTFTHNIEECETGEEHYCFSGHIHPSICMSGTGKQSVTLPCFYFKKEYAVLPAFGKFTGTYPVKPSAGDAVFALVENKIMHLQ
jgi:DNA ligase-associated metallophosphoesterase